MNFESLISLVQDEPVFNTGLLLAGTESPGYTRRQLSGWVSAGKLWQFQRGLYALAPPYQKVSPHPFHIANRMMPGSYVSLQSALSHYGMIPEYVPVITSVTTDRPAQWDTPIGTMSFRHITPALFMGYQQIMLGEGQSAFVATPEKALLDLIHLTPGADDINYLQQLRLQNTDHIDRENLQSLAERIGKPKLLRAVAMLGQLIAAQDEYEVL